METGDQQNTDISRRFATKNVRKKQCQENNTPPLFNIINVTNRSQPKWIKPPKKRCIIKKRHDSIGGIYDLIYKRGFRIADGHTASKAPDLF